MLVVMETSLCDSMEQSTSRVLAVSLMIHNGNIVISAAMVYMRFIIMSLYFCNSRNRGCQNEIR